MRRDTERPYWQRVLIALGKALAYLALFLGCQVAVSAVYSTMLTMELMVTSPGADYDRFYELLYDALMAETMEISLISGLLTLGILLLFFKLRRRSLRQELWLRPASRQVYGWCAGLAFCLYWLVTLVLSMLPAAWMENYLAASEGLYQTGLIAFLATGIVAPVVEEVVFRGLILSRLGRVMSPGVAISLSAVIFGWCHGEAVWFCYAFVLGMIFGYVTYVTGSILPAMLMHLVFNITNELLVMTGDWQPGVVGWLAIFAVSVAGTAFCAFRMRSVLAAVPEPSADPARPFDPAESAVIEGASPGKEPPRPSKAQWDSDSGPGHRFPPGRM